MMMMSVLTVGMLLLMLGGARPVDRLKATAVAKVSVVDADDERDLSSRVTLTFEPVSTNVAANASVPVVFPGYLLPVDGSEESVHAGN
jgi:hypothetical protein